ncbi:MAG: hypothetical protein ABL921_11250 [Pirellula sp.]
MDHIRLALGVVLQILFASSFSFVPVEEGTKGYSFVSQEAENGIDDKKCFGLASGIECLEEGTEVEGVESSDELASRVWRKLTDSDDHREFLYRREIKLRNSMIVPVCSKTAIEEIGQLIQEKYKHLVSTQLWQDQIDPDPNTRDGRILLETREKYLEIFDIRHPNKISSEKQLKELFAKDKDGLVALTASGERIYEKGPPQEVIDRLKLKIDPVTNQYPLAVPSNHAFLLTYIKEKDCFFVYDSNDPRDKWQVTTGGSGDRFNISWRLNDHLGRGPTDQTYYNIRPLDEILRSIKNIVTGDEKHAPSASLKSIHP